MRYSKRIFLVFTLIVLSLSIANFRFADAAVLNGTLANGLVAYYPFNGNANDESGNLHNGVIFGATPIADRFSTPNSAYLFNGTSDYIQVPHDLALEPDVFSISLWFKSTTTSWSNFNNV